MQKKIVEKAIASTTAHGISRVATSRSTPMKVMWSLLFLFFLIMFIRTAVTLLTKLTEDKLTNTYEVDKVPFVFPDLYFCPNNPYSGSYPFSLSEDAARIVNTEVTRLSEEFDARYPSNRDINLKARLIQNSFPVHLAMKHLAQQRMQSVSKVAATPIRGSPPQFLIMPRVLPFSHPENLVCFQMRLKDRERVKFESENWQLGLELSTDPYFSDFKYPGYSVDPIRENATGKELPFQDWSHRYGSEELTDTGFTMLIVPVGGYPSLLHESKFLLAPSNSYTVALSMEETEYSQELHNKYCSANEQTAAFKDPLTGDRLEFAYSYAACYYTELVRQLMEQDGCLPASFPLAWHLRDSTRCQNMSEIPADGMRGRQRKTDWQGIEKSIRESCGRRQPCRFQKYSASFSFSRWPSVGSSIVSHFSKLRPALVTPAERQLISMAKELSLGNHSAHLEGVFRSYIAESRIRLTISAQRLTSPHVFITPAYSAIAFLADTGGLLGLYIGCSLLTVCELLELLYRLVANAVRRRLRSSEPEPPDLNAEQQHDARDSVALPMLAIDTGAKTM